MDGLQEFQGEEPAELFVLVRVDNHSKAAYLYFFIFHLLTTLFVMNLFVGVVYNEYLNLKMEKYGWLTPSQWRWFKIQEMVIFTQISSLYVLSYMIY